MPKATSSPSISDEQRERIMRNRRLAEERRLARLKNNTFDTLNNANTNVSNAEGSGTAIDLTSFDKSVDNQKDAQDNEGIRAKKTKKSFIIDSDDDDVSINTHPDSEVRTTQNKDDCIEISEIKNTNNNTSLNCLNNDQNEATELIDITEGYEFKNKINNQSNHKIKEVVDLVNTEAQNANIIIGNNDLSGSDDESHLNTFNVSVDVHKSNNGDIPEEHINEEILEKSTLKEISEGSNEELYENENHLIEEIPNETEIGKETVNANEENKNSRKENESDFNEKAGSKEFSIIDKENIGSNVPISVELDDLMDVDFCNDF